MLLIEVSLGEIKPHLSDDVAKILCRIMLPNIIVVHACQMNLFNFFYCTWVYSILDIWGEFGKIRLLSGEWTYARAYSPFWRVNVFTLKSETPFLKGEQGKTTFEGWINKREWKVNVIRVNQIRVKKGYLAIMEGECKKGELN